MWHSVAKEGFPPDGQTVMVTVQYEGGVRQTEEGFTYCHDLTKHVDMRYKNGKDFVREHKDGIWFSWHSDGFYEYWLESDYCKIVAWMPYPAPYEGD